MSHITLSQLTTVLQRIVSWAGGRFAAKNTVSGKLEYADLPVVVLASMGSELDGTSFPASMGPGSTYFSPAGSGVEARIMYVKSANTPHVKLSDPDSGVIYCNARTDLLYRWDARNSTMVPVGGAPESADQQLNPNSQNAVSNAAVCSGLALKANDADVVKSVSVNGAAQSKDTNGNVNINVQGGSQVTVTTNNDGTITIHSGENDYTINLNHTHDGMVKLEKYTEATLPQTLDDDIIYVQVDDVTTPQAIEALYIFGLEFTGGGAAPGTPAIYTTPGGSTLNLGENDGTGASGTITVKGRNLTGDLTVAVTANSGLSLSYGSQTGGSVTIDQADAETAVGVDVDVLYSGSGALDLADGLSISGGGASTKSMKVVVTEPAPIELDGVKLTGTQWAETDYYPNSKTEFVFELTFAANNNTEIVDSNVGRVFLGCKANSNPTSYFTFYHISNAEANDHRAYIIQIVNEGDTSDQNLFAPNATGGTYPSAAAMAKMLTPHSILRYTVGSSDNYLVFEPGGVPDSNNNNYTSITLHKKTSLMTYPLNIGFRYSSSANLVYSKFDLTVHRLTITEDGVAVRDYVPRIKNGKVGLLDVAENGTGLFLTSETAKTSGLAADEFEAVTLPNS